MVAGVVIDFNANVARFSSSIDKMTNDLNKFQSSTQRVGNNITRIFGQLGVGLSIAGGIAATKTLASMSDEFTKLSSQLSIATTSQKEFVEAMGNVKRISTTSQTDINALSALYSRLSNSLRDVGITQKEVADISETVALSLKVGGASAEEASSAMLQLSQAFGSGVLRGQEFNAISESAPGLLRALASSMGTTYGKLRQLAADGKITGDVLRKAFTDTQLLSSLREQAKGVQTISGSVTVLKNSLIELVGVMQKTSGSARLTSGVFEGMSTRVDKLTDKMRLLSQIASATWESLAGSSGGSNKSEGKIKFPFQKPEFDADLNFLNTQFSALQERLKKGQISTLQFAKQVREIYVDLGFLDKTSTKGNSDDSLRKFRELQKFMDQEGGFEPLSAEEKFWEEVNEAASKNQKARNEQWRKDQEDALDESNIQLRQKALEAQQILFDVDPIARATHEWKKLTELVEKGLLSQENAGKKFKKEFGDDLDQMGIYAKRFADNVQRSLGDVLYDGLNGNFDNIGDAFKQMLLRMAADAAAAQLTRSMFGNMASTGEAGGWVGNLLNIAATIGGGGGGGNVATFEGGGYTGSGSRTGGVDGKGGFRAILHPNETVIDHVKGGRTGASINYAPVINIDSRTDRAEVQRLVSGAVKQGNAELVDKLQRAGALA